MLIFPSAPEQPTCVLLLVPVELVPIVGSLFGQLEARHKWATEADWQQGYKAFVDLQDQLMSSCLETIVQEIRDLRGIKPEYSEVPIADRTSDMYQDFNSLLVQLGAIVLALRGVADPTDNILQALRGDTPADETRNIVEYLT